MTMFLVDSESDSILRIISNIVGWAYVLTWGLFGYPQIYMNYKLKSVEGFKLDYPFLNLSGFLFYSFSYTIGFIHNDDPLPFENYGLGTIRIQDLVFAWHGVFVSIIFNVQALIYKRGENKISTFSICFAIGCWITFIFIYFATEVFSWIPISEKFNVLELLGFLKVGVSLVKYIPLAYWNYCRKSTAGFSITAFLLDLTGGTLSLTQAFIDFYDGTSKTLNPVKITLGVVCMCYDFFLIFQHYVLYGDKSKKKVSSDSITDTTGRDSTAPLLRDVLVHNSSEINTGKEVN